MKQQLLQAAISDFPLFRSLGDRERRHVGSHARHVTIPRGRSFIWAGTEAETLYLLISGVAKLIARDLNGKETILSLAPPGELVGDIAALSGQKHFFDAVAATSCSAAAIDASIVLDALTRSPRAALVVAASISRRMETLSRSALERASADVPARLAGRLLYLAELLGNRREGSVDIDMPLAQADIGRLADMSRESACKALNRFQRAGLVDYQRTRLRILRPEQLGAIRASAEMP